MNALATDAPVFEPAGADHQWFRIRGGAPVPHDLLTARSVVFIGNRRLGEQWCREHGISPTEARLVSMSDGADRLRGMSGPIHVVDTDRYGFSPEAVDNFMRTLQHVVYHQTDVPFEQTVAGRVDANEAWRNPELVVEPTRAERFAAWVDRHTPPFWASVTASLVAFVAGGIVGTML